MNTNNEIYEKKQKEVLDSTVKFQQAIELLKCKKEYVSKEQYESCCDFVSILFNLSYNNVDQAVDGKKHWIV